MSGGFLATSDLSENEIEKARRKRLLSGKKLLDLTCSNPTKHGLLYPKEKLYEGIKAYIDQRIYNPSPKGLLSARKAITNYYLQRTPSFSVDEENIFITASTSESYSLLFSLLAEPGDNILAPEISYPLFDLLAVHQRLELRSYKMSYDSKIVDDKDIMSLVDKKTKAILMISPHNPTGRVVQKISKVIETLGLPIICDEVFASYPLALESVPPMGTIYKNQPVFHLNGISKMFALPDFKLAWIALNDQAASLYANRLDFLNDLFLSCSSIIQDMLPKLFDTGKDFIPIYLKHIKKNIDYSLKYISKLNSIKCYYPEGGAFLFFEIDVPYDEEELVLRLIDRGVLFYPGYFFGCQKGNHLIMSCLPVLEDIAVGLDELAYVVDSSN